MTISQILVVLRARWKLGLSVWLVTITLVTGFTLLMTKQYTSAAVVVVDGKSIDPIAGVVLSTNALLSGYMATQVDIAQSERVVLGAVRAQHLNADASLHSKWRAATDGLGDFEAWLVGQIQRKYTARPSRESNVMTLSYSAPDRVTSAAMTNALMKSYVDVTLELRVEPAKQYNTFFDARSRQLRDALEQAQNKVSAYQRQNGLLATDERLDIENARLVELSSQVVLMQTAVAEASGRQAEAGSNPERMQEVLNNPLAGSLASELSRQEAHLQELKSRLGNNHPQLIEARSSAAEVRARLTGAIQLASGSVDVTNNVTYARFQQARQSLEQQRTKLLQLKVKRDELAVLQRDAETAQRAYDPVLTRVAQTDLESQNRLTNVSILQYATQVPFTSSPTLFLTAPVSMLLGLLLALGATLWRENLDPPMRSETDVTSGLNQALLMVLPVAALSGPNGHRNRNRNRNRNREGESRLTRMKTRVLDGHP